MRQAPAAEARHGVNGALPRRTTRRPASRAGTLWVGVAGVLRDRYRKMPAFTDPIGQGPEPGHGRGAEQRIF